MVESPPEGTSDFAESSQNKSVLHLVTSGIDYYPSKTVGTESGYYYVERSDGVNANLRYIDYATLQDVYLSSRPESNHLTSDDDSYISSVAGLGEVFCAGNNLFLLRAGAPSYADQFGQDAMAAVFRMNLDGTDRKQIYWGNADEVLASTVAADDQYLYLISRRTAIIDEVPQQNGHLLRLDQKTGETKELCTFSYDTWMIGAKNGVLVFQNAYVDPEGNTNRFVILNEIFVYGIASEKLSVIQKWSSEENAIALVHDDKLITASFSTDSVTIRDIVTGYDIASYSLPEFLSDDLTAFWFNSCYDNHFVFWDYLAENLRSLNLSTGEWDIVTLKYMDPEKLEPRPVEIFGENSRYFLVCYNKKAITRRFLEWNTSVIYETERVLPCFALISKEDYWNSIPNYQPIFFSE